MIKNLFIYWEQKFVNAPEIVQKCLMSWKINNPTWNIIELDKDNIKEYIDIKEFIPDIEKKNIKKCHLADIIRVCLLNKYGGCWCDATTFCIKPLDEWLGDVIETGFFAFHLKLKLDNKNKKQQKLLSNWFLYSNKNNFIMKKWKNRIIKYWNNNNEIKSYFKHHYLFTELYLKNNKFKNLWEKTNKISADGQHFLQKTSIVGNVNQNTINHISMKKTPLYKLTYKYNKEKYNEYCKLAYLLNTI